MLSPPTLPRRLRQHIRPYGYAQVVALASLPVLLLGVAQSDQYRDQIKQRFAVLAAQLMLYPAVEHIRAGYRRSVCGVHSIYYRIEAQAVEIVRILGRQHPEKHL